jgi:hypothetical protein
MAHPSMPLLPPAAAAAPPLPAVAAALPPAAAAAAAAASCSFVSCSFSFALNASRQDSADARTSAVWQQQECQLQ